MTKKTVIIVGAGVSGLTVAYWLKRWGHSTTVLERETHPGGTMRTVQQDGWLIEQGPNSALETTPLIGEMVAGLGLSGEHVYANTAANKRYILRGGALYPIPMSPPAFVRTRLWSTRAKFRLLGEPFVGRAREEESVADFVVRRLGREFLDYAINPFVAGVFAGNPETLSVRSAFPKLYALEKNYGGLIKGMIRGARERRRRAEKAKDRARMFAFRSGMQTFPDALAAYVGGDLRTGVTVRSVRSGSEGKPFDVVFEQNGTTGMITGDIVVLSVPAQPAAGLVEPFAPSLADMLRRVEYPPVAEVFLGYPADAFNRALDGFGYLIPAVEKREILGTIWSSAIFEGRAPRGYVALTSFVGGSRQPEILQREDHELRATVEREIQAIMGSRRPPVFSRIIRWDRAIPQYTLGYQRLIERIEALESETPGLYLCSNYRGGIAVGDCVINGHATAERVRQTLLE
jgi:oxygen-dependent protoporphyrinogen oxidase